MRKIYLWCGVGAIGAYAIASHLFFDADEHDLLQIKQMNAASAFHQPDPGDVYAFHNEHKSWSATPVCALHEAQAETASDLGTLKGVNHWGGAINAALGSMNSATNASLFSVFQVRNAERKWTFEKFFRSSDLETPIDFKCLADANQKSTDPTWTVFVVDSVYEPTDQNMQPLVMFKKVPVQPIDCAPNCPGNMSLAEIVRSSRVAKIKHEWEMVMIH
ncbi:hypothetical protein [Shimia marina]|uniref:Uncharacterized protein n=1 Tax=Shimia marina TaxID=321267 RepID=A0A0P1EQX8_9RHOB|nr:hypothetical protein [Shimia marina]CUH52873.1 hypothetical protein SHM7688_02320 [Shimia marina]SFD89299.1 hypothetical protein SAMN04488037_103124 [Shimia marina]